MFVQRLLIVALMAVVGVILSVCVRYCVQLIHLACDQNTKLHMWFSFTCTLCRLNVICATVVLCNYLLILGCQSTKLSFVLLYRIDSPYVYILQDTMSNIQLHLYSEFCYVISGAQEANLDWSGMISSSPPPHSFSTKSIQQIHLIVTYQLFHSINLSGQFIHGNDIIT